MLQSRIVFAIAFGSVITLCGISEKCGKIFGPKAGLKLEIASAPKGATVKIDGVKKGKTLLTLTDLDVEEGQKQVLTFELDGYETLEKQIVWTQPEQTVSVALKKAARERIISVKSTPTGAKVYIDGSPKGDTPASFSMELVAGEEFNFLLQRKGYDDISEKIKVADETILKYEYNFKREGGKSIPELDEVLVQAEKKWRKSCKTYNTDNCSFKYSIDPAGTVSNITDVTCKFKDIAKCTKRNVEKMVFPSSSKLRSDAFTWKGSN